MRRIVTHGIKNYKDATMEALKRQYIPICKPMSATEYGALLKVTNITGEKEKKLKKHLQDHLDKNFLPSRAIMSMICEGHTEIFTDSVPHKYSEDGEEETVEFIWKDVSV